MFSVFGEFTPILIQIWSFYNHSNTATKIISLMFALYFQEMPFIYPVLRALRLKGMAGNLANI